MKKIMLVAAIAAVTTSAFGQMNPQIQNKKGVDLIPTTGDFGVGINALPVLLYVGDIFGSNSNNFALYGNKFVSTLASNTLFGKYMLTDNTAIRAHLRIGVFNNTFRNELDDDGQDDPSFMVTDVYKRSSAVYNIGAGYEWKRGKTRLRGLYGGEVFFQHVKGVHGDYTYGNPMQNGNEFPTTSFWSSGGVLEVESPAIERVLSVEGGNFNGFGLRAFAGVEYYIAPKICLGTEFGWGAMYGTTSTQTTVSEYWNFSGTGGERTERTTIDSGSSALAIDTDNFNGALYFMFYF